MKILYHHRIASKDGQYVHIEELINALSSLGHEIILVEPDNLTKKDFGKSSGLVASIRVFLPGFFHEFVEFCYSFFDFFKVLIKVIKHKPDCIYERYNIFLVSGVWIKKIFSLPYLVEINAPLFHERGSNHGFQLKTLAHWSEKYVWKNADFALPVTGVLADMVIQAGVDPNKCRVIPNGINRNAKTLSRNGAFLREQLHLKGKLVLGFVGFVRTWHRLDRVLTFIHENRDKGFHLLLIGDGPANESLKQQAQALNVAEFVSFLGVIDRNSVLDYVDAFDIALQPDVVNYASPLKLFEYMMLGKAILAPNKRNILEVLTDEKDALLFEPSDESSFSNQLMRLCASQELRSHLGNEAKKTIEEKKLFWDENAKTVSTLFAKLLDHK